MLISITQPLMVYDRGGPGGDSEDSGSGLHNCVKAESKKKDRVRLETLHAQHEQLIADDNARSLIAGALFKLTQHPRNIKEH